jgi:RecA-family ATPase
VTIFAGKPKIGKSSFLYDVCLATAADRFVLGDIKPTQGDVLYLALEDSQRRLKKRLDKLWPHGDPPKACERLQLAAARILRRPIAIMPAKCLTVEEWLERYARPA